MPRIIKSLVVLPLIALALSGCSSVIDPEGKTEALTLPNGYVPNQAELQSLLALQPSVETILEPAARALEDADTQTVDLPAIDELKLLLVEAFGDEASNFYGEITEELSGPAASRTILPASGANGLTVWHNAAVVKHWGPWWCYFTFKDTLTFRDTVRGEDRTLYCGKKAYAYTDPVTSKTQTVITPLYPPSLPSGLLSGEDLKRQIEYEVAVANSGIVDVTGKTKNGWFPSLSGGEATVEFWSPNLANGYSRTIWKW